MMQKSSPAWSPSSLPFPACPRLQCPATKAGTKKQMSTRPAQGLRQLIQDPWGAKGAPFSFYVAQAAGGLRGFEPPQDRGEEYLGHRLGDEIVHSGS